jgi:adhesin transport system membrane fusion protein
MANLPTLRKTDLSRELAPGRRRASLILGFSALLLAVAGVWAYFAHLDQISRATGQIIPAGRVQVVQAPDGGQILRIMVREGDRVRRGQVLFTLDEVKARAAVDEGRGKVAAFEAQLARIEAELFDKALIFPASLSGFPDLAASQRSLFVQRRNAISQQTAALIHMQGLARRELEMNQPLLASGDVSRSEVMRLERQVVDIDAQIANTRNKYLQDLQAEYAKAREDLVTAREVLKQREATLQDTVITAPSDGLVKNVRFTTPGGVLRAGDELLQVVPTGDELIIEAKVAPSDIAHVRVGQSAAVKFDAYDSSIYGDGEGRVSYISPDTLAEQAPGMQEHTYYRVHVRVDTNSMKKFEGKAIRLQPGMTATVEIKTGNNTVLSYLLKPVIKTLSESLGER